jgi:hypothetical protein
MAGSRIIAQFRVIDERTGHIISGGDIPVTFPNREPEAGKMVKVELELEFMMPMVELLLDGKPREFDPPKVVPEVEIRLIKVEELPS